MKGGVAQLGEHLLCKQGVVGSSPITSTKQMTDDRCQMSDDRFRAVRFWAVMLDVR